MKYIVFLGDGMADYPNAELGNKTPLEVAKKPNMDYFAKKGICGMAKTVPEGMKPGSDTANLSVMGYAPEKYYTGRSPLEAVSVGVPLNDADITFRANLVTLSDEENYADKTMIDYSSDEITTEEAHALIADLAKELNTDTLQLYPGFSYRHILVWRNGELDFELTPPHDISDRKVTEYLPKGKNAHVLQEIMEKSEKILKDHPVNKARIARGLRPAVSLWIWGEGRKAVLDSFADLYGVKGAVVSAVDLIKGIGLSAKMVCPDVEGATGNIHTNFDGKAQAGIELLKENDMLYMHLEAPDECGHRREVENKVRSIELIDEKIIAPIIADLKARGEDYRVLLMPDHPTPLDLKTHVSDPVPFVLYDSTNEKEGAEAYTEKMCEATGVYLDKASELMGHLIKKTL
ncbi:MAG: cofactor-independent phosphoglycerate mutase [Clostridia bacterium]|nr:cofactor-independent phosphoglycerate mutase [Clostridia bacterium]